MIHICYALTDRTGRYSKYLATSMVSVMVNTNHRVHFHLLCDDTVDAENRDRFTQMVSVYGQRLTFYDMQHMSGEGLAMFRQVLPAHVMERFSLATLYRLIAFQVLPEDIKRLVYLDADTYVNCDIADLWQIPMAGYGLGAVPDGGAIMAEQRFEDLHEKQNWKYFVPGKYFNAGVLVMCRSGILADVEAMVAFALDVFREEPRAVGCPDQNVLNVYYWDNYLQLPEMYNRMLGAEQYFGRYAADYGIVHHSLHLALDFADDFNAQFFKYFCLTPWYNEVFLQRLAVVPKQLEQMSGRKMDWHHVIQQL